MFLLMDALDEGHYWMNGSSAERRQHAPSILIYAAKCLQDGDYWSRRRQSFWKVGRPGFFPKSLKYVLRVTNRCSNHPSGVGMGSSPHEFWCNFFDEALSMLAIWTYPSVLSNSREANDEAKKKKCLNRWLLEFITRKLCRFVKTRWKFRKYAIL